MMTILLKWIWIHAAIKTANRRIIRTEMAERSARHEAKDRGITADQVWEERAALYPPGRVATPQEVAEMIAFLASEESSGVSGEAIRVALGSVR